MRGLYKGVGGKEDQGHQGDNQGLVVYGVGKGAGKMKMAKSPAVYCHPWVVAISLLKTRDGD